MVALAALAVLFGLLQACTSRQEPPPEPLVRVDGESVAVSLEDLPGFVAPCLTVRVGDPNGRERGLGGHATAYCPQSEFALTAVSDQQGGASFLAIGFIGDVEVVSITDESGHRTDFEAITRGDYGVALVEAAVGTWLVEAVVDGREVGVSVAPGENPVVPVDSSDSASRDG